MLEDKEFENKLVEALQRIIRGLVTADEENADLIKADMQMLQDELVPVALAHENESVREIGKTLQEQMKRFF